MASLEKKIEAEHAVRELLKQNGMPQPDGVEYGYGYIRLFFEDPKVVLVVDIDRPEDGHGPGTDEPEEQYGTALAEMEDDDDADDDEFDYGYPLRGDEPDHLRADLN